MADALLQIVQRLRLDGCGTFREQRVMNRLGIVASSALHDDAALLFDPFEYGAGRQTQSAPDRGGDGNLALRSELGMGMNHEVQTITLPR